MIAKLPPFNPQALQHALLQQPTQVLYPPPAHYSLGFGEAGWRSALQTSNEQLIPRSLTLGLQAPRGFAADVGHCYRRALLDCLHIHANLLADDREVVAMVLHRGLADCLEPAALGQVLDAVPLALRIVARPQVEVRVDADTARHPAQLREIGCTRLNVTDQAHADGPALLAEGLRAGFTACYYQLQVPAIDDPGFLARLDAVLALAPERVLLPAPAARPGEPVAAAWLIAWQRVLEAGYVPIGGDHYQRGDRAPPPSAVHDYRHCDLAGVPRRDRSDFIGIGAGACSQIGDVLCRLDDDVSRWQQRLAAGHAGVVAGLIQSPPEALASELAQQIACNYTLDVAEFEWRNALSFTEHFGEATERLAPLIDQGWARWDRDVLQLAPAGVLLWRIMAACFRPRNDRV